MGIDSNNNIHGISALFKVWVCRVSNLVILLLLLAFSEQNKEPVFLLCQL